MKPTKTEQAKTLYRSGKIKESFAIFKTFKLGLTKDEVRDIQIAYECMTGKEKFYISLGINPEETIENAKFIVEQL